MNGCFLFVLDDSLRLLFGLGLLRSGLSHSQRLGH